MNNCPNCGRPVPEGQRFCGNCGFDVTTTPAYRPPSPVPVPQPQPSYNYNQPYSNNQPFDFLDATNAPTTARMPLLPIALLLLGVAMICMCCGIFFGLLLYYLVGPYT